LNHAGASEPLVKFLDSQRMLVNRALEAWLPSANHCPALLAHAIHYAVFPGGKRLRPMLTLLASHACNGTTHDAMPAACAVELVHCYSLVHDDLPAMDDDDLRRGRPTCHKVFGEAVAILTGDALLTLAFGILSQYSRSPELAAACCVELAGAAGASGMVGGQVDDIMATQPTASASAFLAPNDPAISGTAASGTTGQAHDTGKMDPSESRSSKSAVEMLESMHARKTGALLRASVRLGGLAAGAAPEAIGALDRYGERIGLVFQITDDLLDVRGEESVTGKRLGKDASRGKVTFPRLLGLDGSRCKAGALCAEACDALAPLGERAQLLEELARFILERDR
jgi:geranylgeranyl diphosphate synthase type II